MKTITMYQAEDSSVYYTKKDAAAQDFRMGINVLFYDSTNQESMSPGAISDFLLKNKKAIDVLHAKMEDDCK